MGVWEFQVHLKAYLELRMGDFAEELREKRASTLSPRLLLSSRRPSPRHLRPLNSETGA